MAIRRYDPDISESANRERSEERDRDTERQINKLVTDVALLTQQVGSLVKTSDTTANNVQVMKDANYVRISELTVLLEKMQGSFATRGELQALKDNEFKTLRKDVDELVKNRNTIVWIIVSFVIMGILGSTVYFRTIGGM